MMNDTKISKSDRMLYHPLNTLKEMGENIWIADGERISFYGLPFTTRMTVVRLANGTLWIHDPIRLCDSLREELDRLGPVSYLISPNKIHYYYIDTFQHAYPNAVTYESPRVRERARKHNVTVRWDKEIENLQPHEWGTDIEHVVLRGGRFMEEVVFYHHSSKTLIVSDFIENFESHMVSFPMRILTRLGGALAPRGGVTYDQRLMYLGRRNALRASLAQVLAFDFDHIILAHGKCITENARKEFERIIHWAM